MTRSRLEAFSDGVIAILITIMVLELHAPHETSFAALVPMVPSLLSYFLSFVFVAIYWNNHHHLMHAVKRINGRVLWANMHLLFWLSLIPLATAWMGEHGAAPVPVAVYGAVLWMAGFAYFILTRALLAIHPKDSHLAIAIGSDWKGKVSLLAYSVAIPLAFVERWVAIGLYVAVALLWWVPDMRIEKTIERAEHRDEPSM